ncbi:bidirectional hydrogenase complex protein HoxU [Trichlorobacter ammonificans]|uniref:[NiFe] hydrogenase, iron sulfur subunit n=1 Tax=Trichlorobacter ammonificans TaxID=2916410 RepID=A0ABM9D9S5_9BACT|nr:bidirectional hydrogenase complex protein HoxU [Trichlorobacter ammonificans]CAH2031903.1 [NiFe] hydrogenase, iron sulfur subunit [Trichlorobacter ammonificans]
MAAITLTLNGELVTARQDQTILEVAREHGIAIPTLCYLEGLEEMGGCRLCMVEVAGSSRPVPACITRVQEGMAVTTHSDTITDYRRMIVELLLAERNHTCAVCVQNGSCELQSLAATLGVDHVRFDYLHQQLSMDASRERFALDHNRCVLCLRCVRVCDAVEGAHTWDVRGRGVTSRIVADLDRPWGESVSCTDCGKCVQLCPTGALFRKGATVGEMVKERAFLLRLLERRRRIARGRLP